MIKQRTFLKWFCCACTAPLRLQGTHESRGEDQEETYGTGPSLLYLSQRHCLHGLLPTMRAYGCLRPRGHSYELPSCTLELHKKILYPMMLV